MPTRLGLRMGKLRLFDWLRETVSYEVNYGLEVHSTQYNVAMERQIKVSSTQWSGKDMDLASEYELRLIYYKESSMPKEACFKLLQSFPLQIKYWEGCRFHDTVIA